MRCSLILFGLVLVLSPILLVSSDPIGYEYHWSNMEHDRCTENSVKRSSTPSNDDPCLSSANPPEDLVGGTTITGTTCGAIGFNDLPFPSGVTEYPNNPACGPATEDDAVWYVYMPDLSFDGVELVVSPLSISGNVTVEAYIGDANAGCTGFGEVAAYECSAVPVSLSLGCLQPGELVYVKVAGEESNCGTFTISMYDITNCDFANECDEISAAQVLSPITDLSGEIIFTSCASGCLDLACPQTDVAACPTFVNNPTVWFEIQTDLNAEQLYVQVIPNGFWTPSFAIYQGTCGALELVSGGTVTNPIHCSTDDTTSNLSNIGIPIDASSNPVRTFYVAVSTEGNIDDPTFEICAAATIGIVACIGGIPPDYQNHTCDPEANFEIVNREYDGSLEGPFCSGELLTLCFDFLFDVSATGNDWLHGLVPTFGQGWDMTTFDPTAVTISPGGAQWFDDNVVEIQEDYTNICTYTDANGKLQLCNNYCTPCPCSGTLPVGTPLPGGWYWVTTGGNGCANTGLPQDGYGILGGSVVEVNFCLDIQVREFENEAQCLSEGDLNFTIQTFTDGVTGCWDDPVSECRKDIAQTFSWSIDCSTPSDLVISPQVQEICNMESIELIISTIDNSTASIIGVTVQENPFVRGASAHGSQNAPLTLVDTLRNTSSVPQVVVYEISSSVPGQTCFTQDTLIEIIVLPQIQIEGESEICIGQGDAILQASVSYTSGFVNYIWTPIFGAPVGLAPSIDGNGYIIPADSISSVGEGVYSYEVVVTDDLGCTAQSFYTLTVIDDVIASFDYEQVQDSVYFSNTTSSFDSLLWVFGDGTSSNVSNPIHVYPSAGYYDVSLEVFHECGVDTIYVDSLLYVLGNTLVDFVYSDIDDCAPLEVQFTDLSTNFPQNWYWEFEGGNPASSTEQNPLVKYELAGSFDVSLTVSNVYGDSTLIINDHIVITDEIIADFDFIVDQSSINLINNSTNYDSLIWYFGDGNNSIEANPLHSYDNSGYYTISLIAFGSCGQDTAIIDSVFILNGLVDIDFSTSDMEGCVPHEVQFEDLSTNFPTQWYWEFDGGIPSSSTVRNPIVSYNSIGTYGVTLQVSNANGDTTLIVDNIIQVRDIPTADFQVDFNGQEVSFNNMSVDADSYQWDFGDNESSQETSPVHQYKKGGEYQVVLIASNECGIASYDTTIMIETVNVDDEKIQEISLYPNPTTDNWIYLTLDHYNAQVDAMKIINSEGRTVNHYTEKRDDLGKGLKIIFDTASSGVFFLILYYDDRQMMKRFMVLNEK